MITARRSPFVFLAALWLCLAAADLVAGAEAARDFMRESPAERAARMAWFNEARFGMFIHWGLYSIPAGEWNGREIPGIGEWIMHHAKIPLAEYRQLVQQFNPVQYDPAEWVRIAKRAGMRYIVITSKHHDGFCLWDSKETDYDVASTPYQRDLLRPLAEAARAAGLRMCFYYSIMDWQHPNYDPLPAWDKDRPGHRPDMDAYVRYMKAQLRELVEGMGPLGILWFDGEWEATWTHERGVDLYNYVRSLQPSIIVNNRVDKGRKGMAGMTAEGEFAGDYGTPEQEVPSRGFPEGVYWESCMTINDTWGYKKNDHNWKSTTQLIRTLVDVASKGGNLLLNVGPKADGTFPLEIVERLDAIGRWMEKNGESIYGTTATPFARLRQRCTKKDGRLYVHVFERPASGLVVLRGLTNAVRSARWLATGAPLELLRHEGASAVRIPAELPDPHVSTVLVEVEGLPATVPVPITQEEDGTVELPASDARLDGSGLRYEMPTDSLSGWTTTEEAAAWVFHLKRAGDYRVEIEYACAKGEEGGTVQVTVVDQVVTGEVAATGSSHRFQRRELGRITLAEPGEWRAVVRGRKPEKASTLMHLRSVRLEPVAR
ncbi:MAG: alpha-L-fucosidase [Kiritimatiellae bacterium]|nr:alpha-L-fucosidase [Kiritimatiellia bacterium]